MIYFTTRSLAILMNILGIITVFFFLNLTYTEFINIFTEYLSVENQETLEGFIPETKFKFFRFIGLTFGVFFFLLGIHVFIFTKNLTLIFKNILKKVIGICEEVKKVEKKYLLMLLYLTGFIFLFRMYLVINFPISYDEAWTFLSFTERGFLVSASFFPTPNNHVFHSLLTSIAYYLPFNTTFNLRFPVLLFGTLSIPVFFFVFRKYFGDYLSFVLTLLFSLLFPTMLFGYQARGYTLVIFFFLISFYGSLKLLQQRKINNTSINWFYLCFGSVLGMYTLPVFIYPYFCFVSFLACTFIFNKNFKQLIRLFISVLVTGVSVIILYSPIFVFSGLDVFNNPVVSQRPRTFILENLFNHFQQTFEFLFFSYWSALIIIFISILLSIRNKLTIENKFMVYIIFVSPLIIFLHSVIPPVRIWNYLVVPALFLLGSFLKDIIVINKNWAFSGFVFIFSILLGVLSFNTIKLDEESSFQVQDLSSLFISKKAKTLYFNPPNLIETNLRYVFKEKNFSVNFIVTEEDAIKDLKIQSESPDYLILTRYGLGGDRWLNKGITGYTFLKKICDEPSSEKSLSCRGCGCDGSDIYIYRKI